MAASFDLEAYRTNTAATVTLYFEVNLGEGKDGEGNPVDEVLRIPELRSWPAEALDAISQGQIVEGMRLAIGGDDLRLLVGWTVGEYEAVFDALSRWEGFKTGRPSVPRPGLGPTRTSS